MICKLQDILAARRQVVVELHLLEVELVDALVLLDERLEAIHPLQALAVLLLICLLLLVPLDRLDQVLEAPLAKSGREFHRDLLLSKEAHQFLDVIQQRIDDQVEQGLDRLRHAKLPLEEVPTKVSPQHVLDVVVALAEVVKDILLLVIHVGAGDVDERLYFFVSPHVPLLDLHECLDYPLLLSHCDLTHLLERIDGLLDESAAVLVLFDWRQVVLD